MKVLFYDCFSGISGDMNLGAMMDLGVPEQYLRGELAKLNLDSFELKVGRHLKNGIEGTKADVVMTKHEHVHRHLKDIKQILDNSSLNENVKALSLSVFDKIAVAEGKIHGKSKEQIHFHEVGAIDSIVDVVGAAVCIDYLKPDKVIGSSVELGGGFVKCAHGNFPVPAPATAEILKGIPVKIGAASKETTTPTGAAILATFVDEFISSPQINILKIGYGLGTRELEIPNVLRVFWGEIDEVKSDKNILVECNIDDMNPENYTIIFERLFENGALDVYTTPINMKKNRPAIKLSVLCSENAFNNISKTLFTNTTTFGLRYNEVKKTALVREFKIIKVLDMPVKVKIAYLEGEILKYKAEYEDCKKVAIKKNIPLKDVYQLVDEAYKNQK